MTAGSLLQIIEQRDLSIRGLLSRLRLNTLFGPDETDVEGCNVNANIWVDVELLQAYIDGTNTTTWTIPDILTELTGLESQLTALGDRHAYGPEIIAQIRCLARLLG